LGFCSDCGNQIRDDAKFCHHCGARQDAGPGALQTSPVKRSNKPVILASALIILLVGAATGVFLSGYWQDSTAEPAPETATTAPPVALSGEPSGSAEGSPSSSPSNAPSMIDAGMAGDRAGPGADTNGDGVISREEAVAEWEGFPQFDIGKWEYEVFESEGTIPESLDELRRSTDHCGFPKGPIREISNSETVARMSDQLIDLAFRDGFLRLHVKKGGGVKSVGYAAPRSFEIYIEEYDSDGKAFSVKLRGQWVSEC